MTAVYLVRHPETTWNVEGRYQGRLDAALTPRGRQQAQLLARAFAGAPIAVVYSSPLGRALMLARLVASESDAPIEIDDRLGEIALGEWEGLYRAEIEERYPDTFSRWYTAPDAVRFPGGETAEEVEQRGLDTLKLIYDRYPDSNVVVVTHSAVVQTLVCAALGLPLRELHHVTVGNCGVTTLCGRTAPGRLLSLNSMAALHATPVSAAAAANCVSWEERRASV